MNRINTLADTCSTLTTHLLIECYELYIKESPPRLCLTRGTLVADSLASLKTMFLQQGAYTCWQCACPIFAARLLLHQHTLPKTITTLNLNIPLDCALFLRHALLASSHPINHTIKTLVQATKVRHLAFLTRETPPCGPNRRPPILINNAWYVPFVAPLPSTDPEFKIPGQLPAEHVMDVLRYVSAQSSQNQPPQRRTHTKTPAHVQRQQVQDLPAI